MKRGKKGFTLIEIVIVVAVIAILTGVAVTIFVGINKNADKNEAFEKAIEAYASVIEEDSTRRNMIIKVKGDDGNEYIYVVKDGNIIETPYPDETEALKALGTDDGTTADENEKFEKIEVDDDGVTVWNRIDTFTITYFKHQGDTVPLETVTKVRVGDKVVLKSSEIESGQFIWHWNISDEESYPTEHLFTMPSDDVTFVAEWKPLAKYWTDTGVRDTSWYYNTSKPLTITTPKQLGGLAYLVNNGNNFSGKIIHLGADIDLSGTDYNPDGLLWTPIGSSSSRYFAGTFDGRGYTIKYMTVETKASYSGLFGYVNGCTIQNVILDSSCSVTSTTNIVGGIIGYANAATIRYVVYRGSVTGTEQVGGIIGRASGATFIGNGTKSASVTGGVSSTY